MSPTARARPLPPEQRRAALIAATLPLIRAHGADVSTRQLAEAAGVAEGTIFRAFPDKDSLIRAAIDAALDCAPVIDELASVDVTLPLRPRLVAATEILQRRLIDMISLMIAVRHGPLDDRVRGAEGGGRAHSAHRDRRAENDAQLSAAVAAIIDTGPADREAFRLPVEQVIRVLRLLIFAGSHPLLNEGNLLTPTEIVDTVLDGVLVHERRQEEVR